MKRLLPCRISSRWLMLLALMGFLEPSAKAADVEASVANTFPPQLIAFSAAKEQQARKLAERLKLKVSPEIWEYFKAARQGDYVALSKRFEELKKRSSQYEGSQNDETVGTPIWQPMIEVQTAYDAFADGGSEYALAFGEGIIRSIPRGSIYFGGTDPGRGLVTALCKSHERADPFYTITQNALADSRYLTYLQEMYGDRIYVPTMEDSQVAFSAYSADAGKRLAHDREFPDQARQLKPGEEVKTIGDRIQVSGQVAVMAINALIVKVIFDHNTNAEYYVEESFPLDWMYPHLTPHELIMKLHRAPLPSLSTAILDQDRAFWTRQCNSLIGDWLTLDTPTKVVCAFVETVYLRKDLSRFTGDKEFLRSEDYQKAFSKLRSSIAGVYQWRLDARQDSSDKARLRAEADFAFRQAFVLCPRSPEAVFRYVQLLATQNRMPDAVLVVRTSLKLDPANALMQQLLSRLESYKPAPVQKAP